MTSENINRSYKKEPKSTMSEMRNSLEGLNSRIEQTEETISRLEDGPV